MKILIKESKPNESEFLIYLMNEDNKPLSCSIAKNSKEKMKIVKELISNNSSVEEQQNMNYNEYITQK